MHKTQQEIAQEEYKLAEAYLVAVAKESKSFCSDVLENKPVRLREAHINYNNAKSKYVRLIEEKLGKY